MCLLEIKCSMGSIGATDLSRQDLSVYLRTNAWLRPSLYVSLAWCSLCSDDNPGDFKLLWKFTWLTPEPLSSTVSTLKCYCVAIVGQHRCVCVCLVLLAVGYVHFQNNGVPYFAAQNWVLEFEDLKGCICCRVHTGAVHEPVEAKVAGCNEGLQAERWGRDFRFAGGCWFERRARYNMVFDTVSASCVHTEWLHAHPTPKNVC